MQTLKDIWNNVYNWLTTSGVRFVLGLIALILLWKLSKAVVRRIRAKMMKKGVESTVVQVTYDMLLILFRLISILIFMGIVGINTASLSAAIAATGLTVGLALQGAFSNFAGGVIILGSKMFLDGDYIEVGGVEGTVESIKLLYTHLVTWDNKVITVPNGTLANGIVINYTKKGVRRVDHTFSISYDADYEKAKEVLTETAKTAPLVLDKPQPFVGMTKHGESSVDIAVRVWVKTEDYWTVYFDMIERVKRVLDENGIEIPYPQLDVHMKNGKIPAAFAEKAAALAKERNSAGAEAENGAETSAETDDKATGKEQSATKEKPAGEAAEKEPNDEVL